MTRLEASLRMCIWLEPDGWHVNCPWWEKGRVFPRWAEGYQAAMSTRPEDTPKAHEKGRYFPE